MIGFKRHTNSGLLGTFSLWKVRRLKLTWTALHCRSFITLVRLCLTLAGIPCASGWDAWQNELFSGTTHHQDTFILLPQSCMLFVPPNTFILWDVMGIGLIFTFIVVCQNLSDITVALKTCCESEYCQNWTNLSKLLSMVCEPKPNALSDISCQTTLSSAHIICLQISVVDTSLCLIFHVPHPPQRPGWGSARAAAQPCIWTCKCLTGMDGMGEGIEIFKLLRV